MRFTFLSQCLLPAVALAGVIARDDDCTTLTTSVKFSSAFTSVLSTGHGVSTTFANLSTTSATDTRATSSISKSSLLSPSHGVSTTCVDSTTARGTHTKATSGIFKSSVLSTSHGSSTTCVNSTTTPATNTKATFSIPKTSHHGRSTTCANSTTAQATHTKATSKSSMLSRSHTGVTTRVNSTTAATHTIGTSGTSKSSMAASPSLSTTPCPTHSLNSSSIYHWPPTTTVSGHTRSLHKTRTIRSNIESFPTIIYGTSTSASSHLTSSLSKTAPTATHKTSHVAISSTTTKCSTTHPTSALSPTTTYSHSHTGPGKTRTSSMPQPGTFTSPHWTNGTTRYHSTATASFASGASTTSGLHWSMPPLWSDRYPTTMVLPTGSLLPPSSSDESLLSSMSAPTWA